jgi:hypothetical protein
VNCRGLFVPALRELKKNGASPVIGISSAFPNDRDNAKVRVYPIQAVLVAFLHGDAGEGTV